MASKQEKSLLGLPETATDDDVVKRISDLVAAEQLLASDGNATGDGRVRIALSSTTGQDRRRGTYVIPPTPRSLVLFVDQIDPAHLAAIEADPEINKVRSNSDVTPDGDVRRFGV